MKLCECKYIWTADADKIVTVGNGGYSFHHNHILEVSITQMEKQILFLIFTHDTVSGNNQDVYMSR